MDPANPDMLYAVTAPALPRRGRADQRRPRVGHPQVRRRRPHLAAAEDRFARGGHGQDRPGGLAPETRTWSTPPSNWATARAASGARPTAARAGRSAATRSPRHRPSLLPGDLRQPSRLRPRVLHGRGMDVTHDGGTTFAKVGEDTSTSTTTPWRSSPTDPGLPARRLRRRHLPELGSGSELEVRRQPAGDPVLQGGGGLRRTLLPRHRRHPGQQHPVGPVRTDNVHGIRNADWRVTCSAMATSRPSTPPIPTSSTAASAVRSLPGGPAHGREVCPSSPARGRRAKGPLELGRPHPDQPPRSGAPVRGQPAPVAQRRSRRQLAALSGDLTRGEDRLLGP